MSNQDIWLAVVVVGTLAGVAVGRYPWFRMNRATIALAGAVLLMVSGVLSLEQAFHALDLNTLTLLFGMMVLNVNLRLAGFFRLVTAQVIRLARTPRQLLALTLVAAGLLSALFLNDTIVLMLTPLVLEVTTLLKRNPIPYLMGLAVSANIGSVATLVGNPQNMLIGSASGIPFMTFTARLWPVAAGGLLLAWLVIVWVYRAEFQQEALPRELPLLLRPFKPLLWKSLFAIGLMVVAFVVNVPVPLAALGAATLLLVTRRIKPERVFVEVDWGLLVFFSGLFILTGAVGLSGWQNELLAVAQWTAVRGSGTLTLVAIALSNLISNVPAVLLFRPLIPNFPNPNQAWLILAMATTLAGNLTLLGSVANLIVAETARRRGVTLSFGEYLKVGLPLTLLSLLWGVLWLSWS